MSFKFEEEVSDGGTIVGFDTFRKDGFETDVEVPLLRGLFAPRHARVRDGMHVRRMDDRVHPHLHLGIIERFDN